MFRESFEGFGKATSPIGTSSPPNSFGMSIPVGPCPLTIPVGNQHHRRVRCAKCDFIQRSLPPFITVVGQLPTAAHIEPLEPTLFTMSLVRFLRLMLRSCLCMFFDTDKAAHAAAGVTRMAVTQSDLRQLIPRPPPQLQSQPTLPPDLPLNSAAQSHAFNAGGSLLCNTII